MPIDPELIEHYRQRLSQYRLDERVRPAAELLAITFPTIDADAWQRVIIQTLDNDA